MKGKGVFVLWGLVLLCEGGMVWASEPNQPAPTAPTFKTELLPDEPLIQRRQVWHFWQMLQVGMTADKVTELLGEPLEKESSETACVWYYHQTPQRLPSGQIQRPRFGFLNFKKTALGGQEQLLLKTWRQPDWNQLPAYSAEQFEFQQKRLEQLRQEKLAEQKRLEEEKRLQEELRKQEEQRRQEELRQQMLAQQTQSQSKGFTLNWQGWPRSYWYTAGGIAAGLIILFLVLKKPFSG